MNKQLLSPFTKEEIKRALMDMHSIKAPSPNGLLAIFYHKFWNIIGDEILKASLNIVNDS